MDSSTTTAAGAMGNKYATLLRYVPLALIGVGALLGFIFLREYLNLDLLRENREALLAWRDENYLMAAGAFVLAYIVVTAFSIPGAAFLTLAGGFLFGLVSGTALTLVGATVGAVCIFLAAKTALGSMLREKAGPWMAKFEKGFQENEISFLLLLRLVPAVPFFIANLLPAFFGAKFFTYVWTTFIGILPGTAVYTSVGTGLGEVFARGDDLNLSLFADPKIWGPFVGLILLALLPIAIKAIRGKKAGGADV